MSPNRPENTIFISALSYSDSDMPRLTGDICPMIIQGTSL